MDLLIGVIDRSFHSVLSVQALNDPSFAACLSTPWCKPLEPVHYLATKRRPTVSRALLLWSQRLDVIHFITNERLVCVGGEVLNFSVLEAGFGDCPLASQWGCAVSSPLQGAIRRFICCEAARWCWGCRHPITMQRCCPAHAVLRFGGDVGRALGAFDVSSASSRLPICQLIAQMAWATRFASLHPSSSSCCPIGQRQPGEGPSATFLTSAFPWTTLFGLPWVPILLQEVTFEEGEKSLVALGQLAFLGLRVSFICTVEFPISPVPFLSSKSPIMKAGSAVARLNSSTGTPFCLSILWSFGWALLPGILPPCEGVTTWATADIHSALISCLALLAASQAGCLLWWPPLALRDLWRSLSMLTHTTNAPNAGGSDIGYIADLSSFLGAARFTHQCYYWVFCAPGPAARFQVLDQLHRGRILDRWRHCVRFPSVLGTEWPAQGKHFAEGVLGFAGGSHAHAASLKTSYKWPVLKPSWQLSREENVLVFYIKMHNLCTE